MKQIFLILFICYSSFGFCQTNNNVKSFEFELFVGPIYANNYNKSESKDIGVNAGLEGRYNLSQTPYSFGLKAQIAGLERRYDRSNWENIMQINVVLTFDYNFRYWRHISLFSGAGLGISVLDDDRYSSSSYTPVLSRDKTVLCFNPRLGAEFFKRIRLTTDINIIDAEHSFIGLNLGFVLGGGNHK